ncbi:MAG: hypothetical protein ACT4PM_00290 [Gemmatimonadales bacterium]
MSPAPAVHTNERGIALLMALVAIVVIGGLITGTFFAGRVELGSGRSALWSAQAQEAAEGGLTAAFADWNVTWNGYEIGGDSAQAVAFPIAGNSGVRYFQTVRRLSGGLYLISTRGEKVDRDGQVVATRLLAQLGKLLRRWIDIRAAVTSRGSTRVGGNATIDGRNASPPGWPACGGPDLAGIRTNAEVIVNGSPEIYGSPPTVEHDPEVVDSIFTVPFDAILPLANITLTPGTYNSMNPTVTGSPPVCDRTNTMNWGEPNRDESSVVACYDYFPIIHSPGELHLTGGRGQGIRLVAGDRQKQGGFEFTGIVLVRGKVITTANSSKVTGAILAENVDLGDVTSFGGTPVVAYSKCAVDAALNTASRGVPLAARSWAQITGR